eukprot:m.54967 g.54967  ORF g.54967 m.54967 type:complete len:610 (+) comp22000_c0_seq1:41-1870(+)
MPTVGVKAEELFERLGRRYTVPEFEDLCFDFGLELDDVTSEKIQLEKQVGVGKAPKDASDEVIFKLDIPANRYDLLCIEGLCRALRVFLLKEQTQQFVFAEPVKRQQLTVTQATQAVRPFCVAAVLRDVTINQAAYNSFIDLQDKLHQNICRNRTLVAIGTHDLDTIQGPFVYDAQKPTDITFVPLRAPTPGEHRADKLLEAYEKDIQLKEYVPIIKNKPKYPVIRDANGVVLSLPPIINGDHSKITLNTKNIFIECTATDMTKAKIVLNMVVCMFSEYCAKPFTIEPVDVIYPDGDVQSFPCLSTRVEKLPIELINRRLGITCWGPKMASLLSRMQLPTEVADDGLHLNVTVPPVRPDIIHGCDIWEDVAIAYGYNNIERKVPTLEGTNGRQQPVNDLADKVRLTISQAGFTEALTFALCSRKDAFDNMRREDDGQTAATISNPATKIFQIVRVNLISGLLKTLSENQANKIPIRVFEVGDVVLLNKNNETGASNHRRCAAVICANSPHFEDMQGLFDYLMRQLGAKRFLPTDEPALRDTGYYLTESEDPAFFTQLGAADVYCYGKRIGVFGVIHPEVLQNYGLKFPCGALELDLDIFVTKTTTSLFK